MALVSDLLSIFVHDTLQNNPYKEKVSIGNEWWGAAAHTYIIHVRLSETAEQM